MRIYLREQTHLFNFEMGEIHVVQIINGKVAMKLLTGDCSGLLC